MATTGLMPKHWEYITTVTDIFSKTSVKKDIKLNLPADLTYDTVNGHQWTNYLFLGELQRKLEIIALHRGKEFDPLFRAKIDLTTLAPAPITLRIVY